MHKMCANGQKHTKLSSVKITVNRKKIFKIPAITLCLILLLDNNQLRGAG